MPDVSSIGHGSVGPIDRAAALSASQSELKADDLGQRRRDHVELSRHARLLDRLRQMPDVRLDVVEKIRRAIAEGSYESQKKLDETIQRLLAELDE